MKKTLAYVLALVTAMLLLTGCSDKKTEVPQEDIVILYTNDVHCGIDENIGYAGLASYKKMMMEKTPYVALVEYL